MCCKTSVGKTIIILFVHNIQKAVAAKKRRPKKKKTITEKYSRNGM